MKIIIWLWWKGTFHLMELCLSVVTVNSLNGILCYSVSFQWIFSDLSVSWKSSFALYIYFVKNIQLTKLTDKRPHKWWRTIRNTQANKNANSKQRLPLYSVSWYRVRSLFYACNFLNAWNYTLPCFSCMDSHGLNRK